MDGQEWSSPQWSMVYALLKPTPFAIPGNPGPVAVYNQFATPAMIKTGDNLFKRCMNEHQSYKNIRCACFRMLDTNIADQFKVFNSLTPICVRAGIKNYCSVEFPRRNSTFFCVFQSTTQPPTTTTMVSRLPLLRNELGRYSQSNTRATHPRVSARALLLGFV